MALPETDLHRIRLWARERVPEHRWDELKVEADVSDRHVDIVEVPVSYAPRSAEEGKKIRPIDGAIAVWTLLKFRFTS